jgi:hypothetical protein
VSRASIRNTQTRQKLPRRPTELRAHFHWLALPFWLQGIQIKTFQCITQKIHRHVSRFTRFRYNWQFKATQFPRLMRSTCIRQELSPNSVQGQERTSPLPLPPNLFHATISQELELLTLIRCGFSSVFTHLSSSVRVATFWIFSVTWWRLLQCQK